MEETDPRAAFLREFLADRDIECPGCRYNLRGLQAGTCPECGSGIEVTIGLTDPRMGAVIAGAIGIGSGLGFNAFILGWFILMKLAGRPGGPNLSEASPLAVGLVITGIAMAAWLKNRQRIRLMGVPRRWGLAAGCFALSLGTAVLFFSVVR